MPAKRKQPTSRKRSLRSPWYPLSEVPGEFFRSVPLGMVGGNEEAKTLSPFFAAIRLYESNVGNLPLVTYRKKANGSRERADDLPIFKILHDRPNRAMSRSAFFKLATRWLFEDGEFFATIRRTGTGDITGLYPVRRSLVRSVVVDSEWNKTYLVDGGNGVLESYSDSEMVHVFLFSDDGIRGKTIIEYACGSLSLQKQIQDSALQFYQNAARPSGYIKFPGRLDKQALEALKTGFKAQYAGSQNAGSLPVLIDGGEWVSFPSTNAEDAQIMEALAASVPDVARWFNLSPMKLGDYSGAHYNSLAAEKAAFYGESLLPILSDFESELNEKIFGSESDTYAEFLVDNILRGDPEQQQRIDTAYVAAGVYEVDEVRAWKNLPAKAKPEPVEAETETTTTDASLPTTESPVADTALSGVQVTSLLAITDKVVLKQYPADAAVLIIQAAFPAMSVDLVRQFVSSLEAFTPEPTPEPAESPIPTDQPTPTQESDEPNAQPVNAG